MTSSLTRPGLEQIPCSAYMLFSRVKVAHGEPQSESAVEAGV